MAGMAPPPGFDPEAATSAYVQAHAAECGTLDCVPDYGPWISLALPAVTLLALWLFLATRLSARARDLASRITNRSWLQAALLAVPLTLFVGAARLLVLFWLQRGVSPAGRLAGQLQEFGWIVFLTAIALPILLALIRRMPRRYWMIPALGASLWLFWMTAHNGYERIVPLPRGPLRADIEAMARASGLSPDRIQMGEQRLFSGGLMDAHAVWSRGQPRAVLSERLFNVIPVPPENIRPPYRPVTAAEVRAIAGHELAHLRLMHLYVMPAILVGLAWLLAWLASAGARKLVSKFGPSWRVAGSTDPAALPAIALTFGIAFYASLPLSNALGQAAEIQADAAGLDIARDPDGAAALAMREARGRPISHPVVEQWLFYDHPSALHRIRHAMAWKARHRAATWRATGLSAPITVRR